MSDLLDELRDAVKKLKSDVLELETLIEKHSGEPTPPPEWEVRRLLVWYEIYKRGGIVSSAELHEIAKKYRYEKGAIGGFFRGKNPSLKYVGVNKDKVALNEWAIEEVKRYMEWLEKHEQDYEKKSAS